MKVHTHRIVITFVQETGEINVTGPLNNGALFLGMLEMAKVGFLTEKVKGDQQILLARPAFAL